MGEWDYAPIQALLTDWFGEHEIGWGVMVASKWRTRVATTRVSIPDVVSSATARSPMSLPTLPSWIVEILSLDDSYADTQERAADYLKMGVGAIWIIDPKTRTAVSALAMSGSPPSA